MKLLLVPTDFSPIADNAMKYAMDMAKATNSNLMLVNMYQIPISFSEVPLVTISLDELRKISQNKLASIKHNIENITGGGIHVYTESILGEVSYEVEKLCERLHPYAVIVGTRGVTGIGKFFLGSNTQSIVEHVNTPVLVIPPGATFKPFKKIGLATDMKGVIEHTPVEPIRDLVSFFGADLHVLNVDYERRHFTSNTPEESLHMDMLLTGMNPVYDFIENKDVEDGLQEFAEKNNLDLLITLPKKQHFLEKILEKSVTRDLIYHTNLPLMCIHQKQEELMTKTQHS
jgi:nucleotide-binding universal stress UspA family protein